MRLATRGQSRFPSDLRKLLGEEASQRGTEGVDPLEACNWSVNRQYWALIVTKTTPFLW